MKLPLSQDLLENELKKTSSLIPIKVKFSNGQIDIVYLKSQREGKFWAQQQDCVDVVIYPSRTIEILSIGSQQVQSKESYQLEKQAYREYQKELKSKRIKQAYRHSKT